MDVSWEEAKSVAGDRKEWRSLVPHTIRYGRWFALENWQASRQFNL